MAECKVCRTEIPNGEEYCKECLANKKSKMDESYLDDLLKSINYDNIKVPPSKVEDVESEAGNIDKDLSDSTDRFLFDTNQLENINIKKQDERILRKEFENENELNIGTDDDILSLLQDLPEENGNENVNGADDIESHFDTDETIGMGDTDEDLLTLLDMISAQDETNAGNDGISDSKEKKSGDRENIQKDQPEAMLDSIQDNIQKDIMDSVQENIQDDIPEDKDLLSIDDLSPDLENNFDEFLPKENKTSPGDMGDIFSEVISALDTLNDKDEPALEDDISLSFDNENSHEEVSQTEEDDTLLQKLFDNKDKKQTTSQSAESSIAQDDQTEGSDDKKTKKAKKKAKKKKNGKVSTASASNENEEDDVAGNKKKVKQKKEAKKAQKKKPVKKVKKEKSKEVFEDPEDNIKINKAAVIFVMTFFILIGGFILIGTDLYSYSLAIDNAHTEFSRKRYDEAYKNIYGADIRKKDQEIYDKIMTVMYVKKELNSYQNYMDINMYPEALDSLLKGLRRYDKYLDRAKELGIKADLDYVKGQILDELKTEFGINEEEAAAINNSEDQIQYSVNVVNVALERKN